MLITWDEPKRLSNVAKHGLDFADISPEFFDLTVAEHLSGPRMKFVGVIKGIIVVVVIASSLGQEAVAIISLRRANRKERKIYGSQS